MDRIVSLQERLRAIDVKRKRGFPLSDTDRDILQRNQRHLEVQQLQGKGRQHAQVAVPGQRSRPPHPSPGSAPLSPAGAGGAVSETFDGMGASGPDFHARLAQHGLTAPFHEDRLSPQRPQRSPAIQAGQRRLEEEHATRRAAEAEKLTAGAIDGKTAPAAEATARYKALGLELPVGVVLRDAGQPLPPPNYPVNGRRGR